MRLILTNNINEVKALMAEGYCPVECSFGGQSVVDELIMDHHGPLSGMESVALRAYRDHYGARTMDPRFVTTGSADADCCFAVAALAGRIPHPVNADTKNIEDYTFLAETIAKADVCPIGLNLAEMRGGAVLLLWNTLTTSTRDTLGFYTGVGLWINLLNTYSRRLHPLLDAARISEQEQRNAALNDMQDRGVWVPNNYDCGVQVILGSRVFGFNEWYNRILDVDPNISFGWQYPVIMAWTEKDQNVTVGCPNESVAEELFGPGGLNNVYSELQPSGWGGRPSVGGSPRGVKLTQEQVMAAAKQVADLIQL